MRAGTVQSIEAGWLRYPEAEKYSGLGRSTLWKLVRSGDVRAAKVGKAVRINRQSLDEYMERRSFIDVSD
jgi:excisionase family DNA binding protein